MVLVLDEFECVSRREILQELAFVLRNAEPTLRVVVLTRNAALPALHRYRLTGEILQVGTADLAFTAEEAQGLLRQHGVRLSAPALASLTEQTGGWAAGLRLSAVAMQRRVDPDSFVTALPSAATALTEYLLDEVLDSQSPPIREFLLRTSVVDRVCAGLADVLTGRSDGDAVLATLQTANVLTSALDEAPGWYRYHPLFARVLRTELHRRHPELVPTLRRQACTWLDRAGFLTEAVSQATAAGDWPLAAATVVRQLAVGKILTGRDSTTLCQLFDSMPDGEPGTMPDLVRAACALARFDLTACADHLDAAGSGALTTSPRRTGHAPAPAWRWPALCCAGRCRTPPVPRRPLLGRWPSWTPCPSSPHGARNWARWCCPAWRPCGCGPAASTRPRRPCGPAGRWRANRVVSTRG